MKRKIVQHGSSSLTITLPVKWTEQYHLHKGDYLDVEESGPRLILTTPKEMSQSTKEVSTTDSGIFTKNNLSHLYQLGYDEIIINFDTKETLDEIKERLPNCIGFEIMEQKEHTIVIKSIATTLDTEFDTLLKKSFQTTNDLAKSLLNSLEQQTFDKLSEIRSLEVLNNKFTDTCIRILNKKGYKIPNRTMQVYEIIKNIERIADEFKHLCDVFLHHKKIDKQLLSACKEVVEYYITFYTLFYAFDPALKKKIYLNKKKLQETLITAIEQSKGSTSTAYHHLLNIVQKTFEGAGGYFALVL